MDAHFRHYQDSDANYILGVCLSMYVPSTTNNRMYYWGLNFRPQEPVLESNWDSIQFKFPWTTTSYLTGHPENYDSWYNITGGVVDTNTFGAKSNYTIYDKQ